MIFFIFTNKTVSDMMIKDNFIDMICHAILSLESMKAHKKLKHFNTLSWIGLFSERVLLVLMYVRYARLQDPILQKLIDEGRQALWFSKYKNLFVYIAHHAWSSNLKFCILCITCSRGVQGFKNGQGGKKWPKDGL